MKKRAGLALGVLLAAALAGWSQALAPAPFPELGKDLEPLRADFNRDAGRVRLLLLLDPT
jgi:hypothetical protein